MDTSSELARYRAIAKEMDEEASVYVGLTDSSDWREDRDRVNRHICALELDIKYAKPFDPVNETLFKLWK